MTRVEGTGPYRDVEGFKEALTSLRSMTRGDDARPAMRSAVQLITHLAWRSPDDTVSWYESSTPQSVMDYADFLAVGTGTVIREAMEVALRHAEAATKDGQAEGVAVLAGIIRQHGADPDGTTSRHPGATPRQAPSPPLGRTDHTELGVYEGEGLVEGDDVRKPRGLHHRIYPYMESVTQYANDRGKDVGPWVVRDRSTALRTERRGRGRAMVRVWGPSAWAYVNDGSESEHG
ncbi:hypothetical protein [Ornithinimicrobium kibberense]|uniref:Uncharacterized protein n=2 Tax=Ornithinimicrobium kibberense TaxID=282060 RepID=A0ABV5V4B4_9MICO|nr:hypothetical protein [Ornithinimicrobium kibberense]